MSKQILPIIAILIILCGFGWYVDSLAHQQISQAVKVTIFSLAGALILSLVIGIVAFGLIALERVKEARAKRKLAERESDVYTIVSEAHGIFVREMNPKAIWRPLHLNAGYQNGREPNQFEQAAWQTFTLRNQSPRVSISEPIGLLPSTTTQVDLLAALDSVQRCLIVGPSDTGKTTLLQWIVSRRLNTSKVIVIDPHAYPNKWPSNCIVIGTGRNYAEISKALYALVQLMTKRYDEIGKGLVAEMAHNRLTIVIDEWRAIVYNIKDASEAIKTLLTESRKAAFSVFVGTHSERVKALGIEGEGDLKDGFAVVRLSNINGQRQASIDTGNGEVSAILPGPYIVSTPQIIDADDFTLETNPNEQEQRILDLHNAGNSYNEIARQIFGNTGGKQTQAIKEVLARFNQN